MEQSGVRVMHQSLANMTLSVSKHAVAAILIGRGHIILSIRSNLVKVIFEIITPSPPLNMNNEF